MIRKKLYARPDITVDIFASKDCIRTDDIISTSVPTDPFDYEKSGFGDLFPIPR